MRLTDESPFCLEGRHSVVLTPLGLIVRMLVIFGAALAVTFLAVWIGWHSEEILYWWQMR